MSINHLFIQPPLLLFTHLSSPTHLHSHLAIHSPIHSTVHLLLCPSFYPSVILLLMCPSIHSSTCNSSVNLFIHLSVHPSSLVHLPSKCQEYCLAENHIQLQATTMSYNVSMIREDSLFLITHKNA